MIRRTIAVALALVVVAGCSSIWSDSASTAPPPTALTDLPSNTSGYAIEVVALGSDDRRRLLEPAPVGQSTLWAVSFDSAGAPLIVGLRSEVLRSSADGQSQTVAIVIEGIETSDADLLAGLLPIVGASLEAERDPQGAVSDLDLIVPSNVGSRADAVARQSLQAPFLLGSPVPAQPFGVGGEWALTVRATTGETESRRYVIEELSDSVATIVVSFEGGSGLVELERGQAFPRHQSVTIDGITVAVDRVDGPVVNAS